MKRIEPERRLADFIRNPAKPQSARSGRFSAAALEQGFVAFEIDNHDGRVGPCDQLRGLRPHGQGRFAGSTIAQDVPVLVVNIAMHQDRIVARFTGTDEQVLAFQLVIRVDDPVHVSCPSRWFPRPDAWKAPSRSEPAAFLPSAKASRAAPVAPSG